MEKEGIPKKASIAVVMTCHNRRDETVGCLQALTRMTLLPGQSLSVHMVDDGSSDGTADAARTAFPGVKVIAGDGNLFWNGGMRVAYAAAMEEGHDFYLWLNDDTQLYPDALQSLLAVWRDAAGPDGVRPAIVVGSTRDPENGAYNYGGAVKASRWHPLKFTNTPPADRPIACETFCGNCVLIPAAVAQRLGNIDPSFSHLMGDTDYGLRARKAGIDIWIAPGFQGDCPSNPQGDYAADPALTLRQKIERTFLPKGLPPREWRLMARRHGGPFWPLFSVLPYVRMLAVALRTSFAAPRDGQITKGG